MSTAIAIVNGIQGNQITSKAGKVVGTRVAFMGNQTAAEIKAELKAKGLKGRELTRKTNEVLVGKTPVAWAKYEAHVSLMRTAGYLPSGLDARAKSAVARFVKPTSATEGVTEDDALTVLAASRGLTVEQLKELLG